jgi:hypothetical protein
MRSTSNEKEPLSVCSLSLDLYLVVDMVNHSVGDLAPDLHLITPIESLDMYSFHSVVIPSDENILEAMVKGFEKVLFSMSSSLKNETKDYEKSFRLCVNIIKK